MGARGSARSIAGNLSHEEALMRHDEEDRRAYTFLLDPDLVERVGAAWAAAAGAPPPW